MIAKAALAAVVFLLVGCSPPAPTPSPVPSATPPPSATPASSTAGLSVDEATTLLLATAGSAATGVEWIRQGVLGDFIDVGTVNMDLRRPVWAAKLTGQWALPCIPNRPCPSDSMSTVVVIDFYTGEFLYQTMSR